MISAVRATSRWPLFVQLACAVLGTLVCFIIQLPIEARSFGDPFAVFLACAFIVALLFGRVSGFTAVLLSSVLSSMFFEPLGLPHVISAIDLIQIEVFALLAIAAVFLADEIRRALIAVSEANQLLAAEDTRKTVRLQEVAHRIANTFSSLDALIHQRARMSNNPTMTFAFDQASELIQIVARLSNRLSVSDNYSTVNSQVYVRDVCEDLKGCAPPSIEFECNAEAHELPLGIAVPLGLVINELVTNALKYAFPDGRAGRIRIAFARRQDSLVLAVEDDGGGMHGEVQGTGMGMQLLNGLARSLEGKVELNSSATGTRVRFAFPAPRTNIEDAAGDHPYLH
ncbi:MAG TPA: ATP-binding protein [Hyphomicrobium sp.]|jgi:two-component sensor histidine kinase